MWPRSRMPMRPPMRPMMGGMGYRPHPPNFFNQNPGQRVPPQHDGQNEMMPHDPQEAQKINALQMQAQHWKQNKQHWEQQQEMQQKMEKAKQCTPAQLDAVIQEEADFEAQYKDWKKQFSEWQEQNKNHPNQEQYQQYAQTWKDYERQMEEKKADIVSRRTKLQESLKLKNEMMARPMGGLLGHGPRPPVPRPMARPMIAPRPPLMPTSNMPPRNFGPGQFPPNPRPFPPTPAPFMPNQGNFGPNPPAFGPNQGNVRPNPGTFVPPPNLSAGPPRFPPPIIPSTAAAVAPTAPTTMPTETVVAPAPAPAPAPVMTVAPPVSMDELPPGTEPAMKNGAETMESQDDQADQTEEPQDSPEQEKRIESDSWSEEVAQQVKQEDEKILRESMIKNVDELAKAKERLDSKVLHHLVERDKRLAFNKVADFIRQIQEQQERIETIKLLCKLQKKAEQEAEEKKKIEEQDKERAEKKKAEQEKKQSEKKSSQLQQQIEKALDRASGKAGESTAASATSAAPGDSEKKIQIKVNLKKEDAKEDKKDKDESEKKPRSYRRRSFSRSRSRSRSRRSRSRSRSRRSRSRSRGRGRRSRSRGRGRRSRSPRRRRSRSRSPRRRRSRDREREKTDIFGRSIEIRRPYDEEKEKARKEREMKERSRSNSRLADERKNEQRTPSMERRNGRPKTSLVPYDDEEEDRTRPPEAYAPPRREYREDPYRRDYRDPARDYRDPARDYREVAPDYREPYTEPARMEYTEPESSYRDEAPKFDPFERPAPPLSFGRLSRVPLYDRPPVDNAMRRLIYGGEPVPETYPEQKYNRDYSLFGDDEDEAGVFDYAHGRGKAPEDPYTDPDGGTGVKHEVALVEDYSLRPATREAENRLGESTRDYSGARGQIGYDYDLQLPRDPSLRDRYMSRDDRSRDERSRDSLTRTRGLDRYDEHSRSPLPVGPPPPAPPSEEKCDVTSIEDLLMSPGRERRPPKMVIIIRGPPGSGKTYVSKLIREREVACGGAPPRMLCLDDYFMVETEKEAKDPETGRIILRKVMEYEYESFMENSYRVSMLKSFKKTVDDGYFPFIILDAVNAKIKQFEEFWSYANSKGFQIFVAELETEAAVCAKRNIHGRTLKEITDVIKEWEPLPPMFSRVDVRSLLQDAAITDVEMTDHVDEPEPETQDDDEDDDTMTGVRKSKWELDTSESKLDRLDGLKKPRMSEAERFEDYLQLPDDYDLRDNSVQPGRKRVRWADIEERKDQQRQRSLGFVVGHTNWDKIMDDNYADRALNRTKYF